MIKNKLISAAIFTSAAITSQFAFAADGTITINGNVTAQTCTINGNGSGSNNFTVTLPSVSASALTTAGDKAGETPFSIALTACTPASGTVHTYFEPGATVNTATGNLIVAAGGALNVEIGLENGVDSSPIALGAADTAQNSKTAAIGTDGTATLPYFAQYVATGTATPGLANSSVMYTLVYQ